MNGPRCQGRQARDNLQVVVPDKRSDRPAPVCLRPGSGTQFSKHKRTAFEVSKQYYVYLITNERYGTLYVGVTNDLVRRIYEHREGVVQGFSKQHGLSRLVWFEAHDDVLAAIGREKAIKRWRRDWKMNLIQAMNPKWDDLYESIV